jgi:hypothetical protein
LGSRRNLLAIHHIDETSFLYKDDGTVVSDLNGGQLRNRGDGEQNPLINNVVDEVRKLSCRAYNGGITSARPS